METLSLLIIFPLGALLIGVAFAIAAYLRGKVLPGVIAALWAAYGVYEYLMYARVLCTGECNIRIDLLVIYPVLLIATIAGIVSLVRKSNSAR